MPPELNTVVTDLDGTLIAGNSFTEWVRFLLLKSASTRSFGRFAELLVLAARRKILRIDSHREFKSKIDALQVPGEWIEEFSFHMAAFANMKVLRRIEELQAKRVIVTTAAPCCYCDALIRALGIHAAAILCSHERLGQFFENVGANKLTSLKASFPDLFHDDAGFLFFTDHVDDLPMAAFARAVILCHPSEEAKRRFRSERIDFELIE